MSEKSSSKPISSSEFRNRLSHWLDEATRGNKVVVSRRGKPEVYLEAVQKCLPLKGMPESSTREFYDLLNRLDPMELALAIHFVRELLETRLEKPEEEKN